MKIYCGPDKFYGRSNFGQYDQIKNRAPYCARQFNCADKRSTLWAILFSFIKIGNYVFAGLAEEQEYLTSIYENATQCIPVLLSNEDVLTLSEIYAPLLIEEDLDAMKRTRRPDEPSGSRTIQSLWEVFQSKDKLSTRIFIKGEAGSGKSVFCLKLVESWCQMKQCLKHGHSCEQHSPLIRQLAREFNVPELLTDLKYKKKEYKLKCDDSGDSDNSDTPLDKCADDSKDSVNSDDSRDSDTSLVEVPCSTCDMQRCLSDFDLLYYVPLRDATLGKTSVVDLICDVVCNECQDEIDRTKRLLSSQKVRCLILLDGLDEWVPPAEFTGLPVTRGLSIKCTLLLTMRPWKLVHLQLKPKIDDRIVTVCGLSSYSVAKLIESILVKFYGIKGETLKSKFLEYCKKVQNKTLKGLLRMPIMLIAACHLWHEDDARGPSKPPDEVQLFSMTHLYLSLLEQMIKNAVSKQSEKGGTRQNAVALFTSDKINLSLHPGLPAILRKFKHVTQFINMLLPFCDLAYTDLVSTETKLIFHKGYLESKLGQQQVDLAHKLGLISQAKVRSNIGCPQNVNVSFYHKSVQELLAAIHLTCGTTDSVQLFCDYCSTFAKVMDMANVTLFVMGLDPILGCRLSEHINKVVNSESDIKQYRRTLDNKSIDRVLQLYRTQLQWYRELTHSRTLTGDTSPPPSLHITDIHLGSDSDHDTVRLTGELMCSNRDTIVSVTLWYVRHPLHGVIQSLPQCPHLSALHIDYMRNTEDQTQIVAVIPHLTQLDIILYWCHGAVEKDVAVVAAVLQLTQLRRLQLWCVSLGNDGVVLTADWTRLQTVVLWNVSMSAGSWGRFVSSLLTVRHPVDVTLDMTNIDAETVRRIQTSPHFTVTEDKKGNDSDMYEMLSFTAALSHPE